MPEQDAAERGADEDFAAHAGNHALPRQIAAVEAAPEQAAGAVGEHAREKAEQIRGVERIPREERVLFLQRIPCVAEEVIDVGDGDFHAGVAMG